MRQLKTLRQSFNRTIGKVKYLITALVTGLLIASLFQISLLSQTNDPPRRATFDPSQMNGRTVQISTNAFRGVVRVRPNGKTPDKAPKDYPVMTSSDTVRDQLWVAGDSQSWAHFQFWGKEAYQKPRVDPLVQAGINGTSTKYTFPCQTKVGAIVIGWEKVSGDACERIFVGDSRYKTSNAESFLAEKDQSKVTSKKSNIANGVSDSEQLTISRSQELTLVYVYDLNGDVIVDVLVGAIQVSAFGSVNAGTRYIYSNQNGTIQTINPSEIAKSPSVQTFLDKANWSPELAPLIDKFTSAISLSSSQPQLNKEQQEILDAHNRWRAQVNVPPLRWSKKLADSAQEWADNPLAQEGGGLHHNGNLSSGAGENIAASSDSVTEMVDMWGSEGKDYDYATNSCRGDTCGHYTQIVWRNTTELGCGVAPHKVYGRLLVCDYSPPGNYNGERPY